MSSRPRGGLHPVSLAPMMDVTDRHFRFFLRLITGRTLLYTEMVTTGALLRGDVPRHLDYSAAEHPVALQLGGSEPDDLARCCELAERWGYDEIDLNVGCPSDRVGRGGFGARLMLDPPRVAACVAAMRGATGLPVTVKHRIGVDDHDSYAELLGFVDTVAAAGADRFVVHARKAWLSGLSPKQNRTVPPLRYDDVYRLKAERSLLRVELNGGVLDLDVVADALQHIDGVMIGRAAQDDPWVFHGVDERFYGVAPPTVLRSQVVAALEHYLERHLQSGGRLHAVTRHILGLFKGQRGARAWRRVLSEEGTRPGAGLDVLHKALDQLV